MKRWIQAFALLAFLAVQTPAFAQCAMCRMNAENASNNDSGVGRGLNNGILYLMGIPYLLLTIGGVALYRMHRASAVSDK